MRMGRKGRKSGKKGGKKWSGGGKIGGKERKVEKEGNKNRCVDIAAAGGRTRGVRKRKRRRGEQRRTGGERWSMEIGPGISRKGKR